MESNNEQKVLTFLGINMNMLTKFHRTSFFIYSLQRKQRNCFRKKSQLQNQKLEHPSTDRSPLVEVKYLNSTTGNRTECYAKPNRSQKRRYIGRLRGGWTGNGPSQSCWVHSPLQDRKWGWQRARVKRDWSPFITLQNVASRADGRRNVSWQLGT